MTYGTDPRAERLKEADKRLAFIQSAAVQIYCADTDRSVDDRKNAGHAVKHAALLYEVVMADHAGHIAKTPMPPR